MSENEIQGPAITRTRRVVDILIVTLFAGFCLGICVWALVLGS